MSDIPVLGLVEEVEVFGATNSLNKKLEARIDTGATNSSVDLEVAQQLQLGPIIKTKTIRNSHGKTLRPVVHAKVLVGGKEVEEEFTIANRSNMKYKILIGQNVLTKGFMINPSK